MGWAGGADLAEGVWRLFRKYVSGKDRRQVARQLIKEFQGHDWDTIDEAETLATDAGWYDVGFELGE